MLEVFGEPLIAEQKQQYLNGLATECGYKQQEEGAVHQAHTPAPTTTSTSASSSSGATRDVKNEFDKKAGRQLTRRVTDEGPAINNLTQDMEPAAEAAEAAEEEEELMPDPPVAQQPAGTPAESADIFWQRMNAVLDNKMTGLGQEFTMALHAVEVRLGTEIQKERETRQEDTAATNKRIDSVLLRLEKPEMKENRPQATREEEMKCETAEHPAAGAWHPKHVILGGWRERTARDTIEKEAAAWLATMPQAVQEACLRPDAPKKYGEIAKVKVMENPQSPETSTILPPVTAGMFYAKLFGYMPETHSFRSGAQGKQLSVW